MKWLLQNDNATLIHYMDINCLILEMHWTNPLSKRNDLVTM